MRDKLKDMNYFNTFISEDSKRIAKFNSLLEQGGVMEDRILPVKTKIHDLKLGILIAEYSKGTELEIIEDKFLEILQGWGDVFRKEYYNKNLVILSLAVLFDVGEEEKKMIRKIIDVSGISDWLIHYLMKTNAIDMSEDLLFEDSFKNLKRVVFAEDKVGILADYLSKDWYCEDCGCYEAHKSKQNVYYGYWSFEAGAIAKLLKIDDLELKNAPFYPYDLVHFKNK